MKLRDIPTSYAAADTFLRGKDGPKMVCRNTHIVRRSPTSIALRHWWADLVTWNHDGSIVLQPRNRVTSKVRMSLALGTWKEGRWYVYANRGTARMVYHNSSGGWWRVRSRIDYTIDWNRPVTIWPDGRTTAQPLRPADHKPMCKCPRCYRHSKYDSGWRRPWHDPEQVFMLLTKED